MRRLIAPALLAAALTGFAPGAATAQDRPSLLDYFSFDIIVQRLVQSGIMALRTQFDLKYSDLSVDIRTGAITLTDVVAWPLPDWDIDGSCEVAIGRAVVRSGALDEPDRIRLKAQLLNTGFPASCLPEEPRMALTMAGLDAVEIPRLTVDIDYGVPGSDATMRAYADIADVAVADLTAQFAYIWLDARQDMDDPVPVIFLESATLALENRGLWRALRGQLPPPFTGDGAGLVVEGAIGQALLDENPPDAGLSDSQRAFVKSVAAAWPAFLAAPESLVLETGIDGDVFLDFEAMEDDLRIVFDTLRPTLALRPARATDMIPRDTLAAALGDGAGLGSDDLRAVGEALITGRRAPRNLARGLDILGALARAGDGGAALLLSEAMETRDAAEAYRWALLAGATGEAGATARLDRLERRMALAEVLALQVEATPDTAAALEAAGTLAAIRDRAAMRLSGRGLARSYPLAAAWAMLASAAGDPEGADILAEIDERVRLGGKAATAAWASHEDEASGAAMRVWLDRNLPAALSGRQAGGTGAEGGDAGRKGKKN